MEAYIPRFFWNNSLIILDFFLFISRKFELYGLDWPLDIELEQMCVVGAPFGGPIAIVRDQKQIIPLKGSTKPLIRIINSAGTLISTITVSRHVLYSELNNFS